MNHRSLRFAAKFLADCRIDRWISLARIKSITRFAAAPRSVHRGEISMVDEEERVAGCVRGCQVSSDRHLARAQSEDNSWDTDSIALWMEKASLDPRWRVAAGSRLGGSSGRAGGNDRVIVPGFVSGCLSATAKSPTRGWNLHAKHGALPRRAGNKSCDVYEQRFTFHATLLRNERGILRGTRQREGRETEKSARREAAVSFAGATDRSPAFVCLMTRLGSELEFAAVKSHRVNYFRASRDYLGRTPGKDSSSARDQNANARPASPTCVGIHGRLSSANTPSTPPTTYSITAALCCARQTAEHARVYARACRSDTCIRARSVIKTGPRSPRLRLAFCRRRNRTRGWRHAS